ncbi:hypothetical protein [Anthocerotibacter panamensis]|uniref:hypothetical protein n=1 Tax=Anthocerotibacter panamensis TaxID=2857077 RepID=UPI001C408575|nr:hypothetical protein [Anthocerotibacter panamensis]
MLSFHIFENLDFWVYLAKIPPGQDVLLNIQNFWMDLLKTGKLWAGIIGFVLGFLVKSITS